MGLKYTVHVQLEANRDGNRAAQIDESFAYVAQPIIVSST